MQGIGDRISIYRRRRGLSQPVLAQLVGRSESWLSQVERGIRPVENLGVLVRLAEVLHVEVGELAGAPLTLAPNGGVAPNGVEVIRAVLMRFPEVEAVLNPAVPEPPARDLAALRIEADEVWRLRQASRYSELAMRLPGLLNDAERQGGRMSKTTCEESVTSF